MGLFSSSEFDELSNLVERATSEFIPAAQEDLALNLEITDIIKSKRVAPKDALRLLLARLTHENPNVQLLSLQLFDKCVKNAGKLFLIEMAGREFVDVAVSMMDDEEYGQECNQVVQDKLIELFQEWALLFQSDPSLAFLYDTYHKLKEDKRVIFPVPARTLDQIDPLSIVSSIAPPEWNDSPTCQRCRDTFTMTNRKHHCRKCGGTFCQLCSSNEMVLLEMGISDPVRVCDTCYKSPETEKRNAKIFKENPPRPAFEESEDADLKKAIELSLKEQQQQQQAEPKEERFEDEEALKKAIEASLKEVGPTHLSPVPVKKEEIVNAATLTRLEIENISMFHQLIGRLIRNRPHLTPEDASDLKKLATEMRRLQQKSFESETVKIQLEESLKGYEILFGNVESVSTSANSEELRLQVQSPPNSEGSKDLNVMRNEVFGDVTVKKTPEISMVRNRLGSLSLENQSNFIVPSDNSNLIQRVITPEDQFKNIPIIPSYTSHNHNNNHHHQQPQIISRMSMMPLQTTPIQFCPDMTIHPHPIHPPMMHENPYAIKKEEASINDDKKDKKKKKKSRKEDKKEMKNKKKDKSKKKQKEAEFENEAEIKKRKKKEKTEKGEKEKKKRKHKEHKEREKHKEHKEHKDHKDQYEHNEQKEHKDHKEHKKKRNNPDSIKEDKKRSKSVKEEKEPKLQIENSINSVDESGRKSPINLIDL